MKWPHVSMARLRLVHILVFWVFAEAVSALVNKTLKEVVNDLQAAKVLPTVDTRRAGKGKNRRSTSSSDGERKGSGESADDKAESLGFSTDSKSSESKKTREKKYQPISSAERRGWRKWHRKCTPCADIDKKWRDPGIGWICGAYQRARRSFKSTCMMHYRNCQDGTMFVRVSGRRCKNTTSPHFFYDYLVKMSGDTSKTGNTISESKSLSASQERSSDARRVLRFKTKKRKLNATATGLTKT